MFCSKCVYKWFACIPRSTFSTSRRKFAKCETKPRTAIESSKTIDTVHTSISVWFLLDHLSIRYLRRSVSNWLTDQTIFQLKWSQFLRAAGRRSARVLHATNRYKIVYFNETRYAIYHLGNYGYFFYYPSNWI